MWNKKESRKKNSADCLPSVPVAIRAAIYYYGIQRTRKNYTNNQNRRKGVTFDSEESHKPAANMAEMKMDMSEQQ